MTDTALETTEPNKTEQIRTIRGKRKFLAAAEEQLTILGACKATGIGRQTVYDWIKTDEQFKLDLENLKEAAVDHLEESLYRRALTRDTKAAMFILNGRRADVYKYYSKHEVKVEGTVAVETTITNWDDLILKAIEANQRISAPQVQSSLPSSTPKALPAPLTIDTPIIDAKFEEAIEVKRTHRKKKGRKKI